MNALVDTRELVHRFNRDEAIWRNFEKKREQRRRDRVGSLIPDEILDAIDWREAERENRNVRCIGFPWHATETG